MPGQPGSMGEEIAGGHILCQGVIFKRKPRYVLGKRFIQIQLSLLSQHPSPKRRESLGAGADGEKRIFGYRQLFFQVSVPETFLKNHPAIPNDPYGKPRRLPLSSGLLNEFAQLSQSGCSLPSQSKRKSEPSLMKSTGEPLSVFQPAFHFRAAWDSCQRKAELLLAGGDILKGKLEGPLRGNIHVPLPRAAFLRQAHHDCQGTAGDLNCAFPFSGQRSSQNRQACQQENQDYARPNPLPLRHALHFLYDELFSKNLH